MGYIGNEPGTSYSSISYQDFTGGSGTNFTLDYPVGSSAELEVFVNNVRQEPGVAYTVSGTSLTMTGTIVASDEFYVLFQGKAQQTIDVEILKDESPQLGGDLDTNGNDINFGDNDKAFFGDGSDLQIYHNGSNSYIDDAGTGVLFFRSNQVKLQKYTGEELATFVADGAATLYHNDSSKLATTATGVDVTGTVTATAFVGGGTLHAWANFKQTGTQTINDSVGMSSITDNGSGTTTLTFSNTMANTTFTATSGHMNGGTKFQFHDSDSTANVKVINRDVDGGGSEDGDEIATQVAGDAA